MSNPANPFEPSEIESQKNEVESVCSELLCMSEKVSFKEKMKDILCCQVCCELRRCPIYQCKYGHLICTGCLNSILTESRIQNEIASCPSCHTNIGLDICYRNVAVEKTISELPIACCHCLKFYPPQNLNYHKSLCDYRPVKCSNAIIGCVWKGSYAEKEVHEKECMQLSCSGDIILELLTAVDSERKKDQVLYNSLTSLLSVEQISYADIQLKSVENISHVFETSLFSAFDKQWMLRVFCYYYPPATFPSNVSHKLILKTLPICSFSVKYVILPGPLQDLEVKPAVHQFKFSDEALETPIRSLEIPKSKDWDSIFKNKRTNLRILMFLI